MRVDSIEKWSEVSVKLEARGYMLWQTQFGIESPNGFIARFMVPDDALKRVELVTFDAQVADAMVRYKPPQRS